MGDSLSSNPPLTVSSKTAHYTSLSEMGTGGGGLVCYRDEAKNWAGTCMPLYDWGPGPFSMGCEVGMGVGSPWHIGTAGMGNATAIVCYADAGTGKGTCNLLTKNECQTQGATPVRNG